MCAVDGMRTSLDSDRTCPIKAPSKADQVDMEPQPWPTTSRVSSPEMQVIGLHNGGEMRNDVQEGASGVREAEVYPIPGRLWRVSMT